MLCLIEINDYLLQQLRTLYKAWFIDCLPFGNQVPSDWREGRLSDVLKLTKNSTKKEKRPDLLYLPIDVIPMNDFALTEMRPNSEAQSSLITFDKDDILIGAMRVYFHRVLPAPCAGITRSTCFVLKAISNEYFSFALLTCDLDDCINFAQSRSKGSTMPYAIWEGGLGWNFTQNGTALLTTWDMHFLIKWDSYLRRQPYSQSTRARCPS